MMEVEATLIICASDPRAVLDSVARLPAIAGYPLLPQDPVSIHDYHVDTAEDTLRRSQFSLRVREINTLPWLTLKGPPHRLGPGIEERLEIEVPWSQESLERISQELVHHGIPVPLTTGSKISAGPREALVSAGLKIVQHRENYRQIRKVMPLDETPGPTLAELSIDSVAYHLEGQQIRHYEVEVEAKSEAGIPALPVIVQALVDTYPSTLQRWDHGKLSIGRAVAALLRQGGGRGLLNDQNQLMPQAYHKIDQILSA